MPNKLSFSKQSYLHTFKKFKYRNYKYPWPAIGSHWLPIIFGRIWDIVFRKGMRTFFNYSQLNKLLEIKAYNLQQLKICFLPQVLQMAHFKEVNNKLNTLTRTPIL